MAEKFAFTYEQKKRMAQQTAQILTEEIGLKGDAIDAVELIPDIEAGNITIEEVEATHGESVARILRGLNRIQQLYDKNPAVESENFRNLLLSFAEDMRVILIMIANRVNLMRQIRDTENLRCRKRRPTSMLRLPTSWVCISSRVSWKTSRSSIWSTMPTIIYARS